MIDPIPIGVIRYTSTDRLHRKRAATLAPVFLQPADFLARRTAVLGMTRTGKSNMLKQTVAMVKRVSDDSALSIAQIIFDINGEYANANQQYKGAISEVYPKDTIRYRGVTTSLFHSISDITSMSILRKVYNSYKHSYETIPLHSSTWKYLNLPL